MLMCPSQNGDSFRCKKITNKLKVLCFPKIDSDCNAEIGIRFINFIKKNLKTENVVFSRKKSDPKVISKMFDFGHRNDPLK